MQRLFTLVALLFTPHTELNDQWCKVYATGGYKKHLLTIENLLLLIQRFTNQLEHIR